MEIKKGARGNEVADIQQRLHALQYSLGPTRIDGFFGESTEKAVKAFQKDRKLEPTGFVDEETWRQLVAATYKLGNRALYLRSPFFRGDDVRKLQRWLNTIGFRTEPTDGIFGPLTEKAVRDFQENTGLTSDGIVGPSTITALINLRSIIDKDYESNLSHLLGTDSVVAVLESRRIAIGCPTPHKQHWLAAQGNPHLLCADLAHRLSNLLEILGAQVSFFRIASPPPPDVEVAIIFKPLEKNAGQEGLSVMFDPQHQESRQLAASITQELKKSLREDNKELATDSLAGINIPSIAVSIGNEASFLEGNLKKDVIKQKIAGAIFDGLKRFLITRSAFGQVV